MSGAHILGGNVKGANPVCSRFVALFAPSKMLEIRSRVSNELSTYVVPETLCVGNGICRWKILISQFCLNGVDIV